MLINGKFRCAKCTEELNDEFGICACGCDNRNVMNPLNCLQIGSVLSDEYVIGTVIGQGGFGITYVGWDKNLDKKLAIKEFFMGGFSSRNTSVSQEVISSVGSTGAGSDIFELQKEKFVNEARVLASLTDEPGIVNVYRFFKANNTAYIVMEFVEGITLKTYLKQKGKLSVDETMRILVPVMNSLEKIHRKNLIHRDISPDNIIIPSNGQGKLIDFGATRENNNGDKSLSVVLKHGFAPLEQYQSHGNQGPWTDVYALSATIYMCIAGIAPDEVTERIMDDTLKPLCVLESGCSSEISEVIQKGLSIPIDDRYRSVGELREALLEAVNKRKNKAINTDEVKTVALWKQKPETRKEEENQGTKQAEPENLKAELENQGTKQAEPENSIAEKNKQDTAKKAQEEGNTAGSIPESEEGVVSEKRTLNIKKKQVVLLSMIVACVLIIVVSSCKMYFEYNYNHAVELMNDGKYIEAYKLFETLKGYKDSEELQDSIYDDYKLARIKSSDIGDEIILGNYNGNTEWIVLAKEDEKILVISKYAIEKRPYNEKYEGVTWEKCTLRSWLNGTYLAAAFSSDEQARIIEETIANPDNSRYGTDGGNNTTDKVFLLSIDEVNKYFATDSDRKATLADGTSVWWWLRSPGIASRYAADVLSGGSVNDYGSSVNSANGAVRPALWIDTSNP